MTPAISVTELTKKYGDIDAVRGIDFEVAAGETFGFLGPNGAGKSTTIKILCTLADPTSGTARVAGHDVLTERDTVKQVMVAVMQVSQAGTAAQVQQAGKILTDARRALYRILAADGDDAGEDTQG